MAPPPAAAPAPSPFPSPNTVQPSSLSRLTLSDKLLLAQAVHHIGSSPPDWGRVSSILLSHPLIKTKTRLEQAAKAGITLGRVFGSRECERAWVALMRQYNLVLQPGEKDPSLDNDSEAAAALANRVKEARGLPPKVDRSSQLALAQFLYAERIREIQESIKAKESIFKTLVSEIDLLKSGKQDETLLKELEQKGILREQQAAQDEAKEVAIVSGTDDGVGVAEEPVEVANVKADEAHSADRPSSKDADVSMADAEATPTAEVSTDLTKNVIEQAVEPAISKRPREDADIDETGAESKKAKITAETKDAAEDAVPVDAAIASEDVGESSRSEIGKEEVDDETSEAKRPTTRRSKRSGRNASVTEDDRPSVPPATPAPAKNSRVEALRSREVSGASPELDEDRDSVDAEKPESSRPRTSTSPAPSRKTPGRGSVSARAGIRRNGRGSSAGLGVEADGQSAGDAERDRITRQRKREKMLLMLLNEVSNHTHGNLFHAPIKKSDAPDYYALIRHPLDLKTIKAQIKDGKIHSATQLRRALMQMFANSLIYNRPGSEVHRMASEMRDATEDLLDKFEQTQMSANAARR